MTATVASAGSTEPAQPPARRWWLARVGLAPARPAPSGRPPLGLGPAGLAPAGRAPAGLGPAGLAPAGRAPAGLGPTSLAASVGPPWLGWARRVVLDHTLVTDSVLALLVAVVSTPWLAPSGSAVPSWLLQAGLLLPLVWRRRYPVAVFMVIGAVALVQWLVGVRLVADVSLLVALATVATYRPRQVGLAAAGLVEVGAVMASLRWSFAGSSARSLVFLSGLVAAGLLVGTNLRSRRALVASLTQRAERLEAERDQHARLVAATERARIAREMHDVIGHSLAVMVSLADGASAKLAADPPRAAAALGQVSEIGRQALGETRRLLDVLRADQRDGLAPQPGLADLAELAAQARATGLAVTVEGPSGVSPATGAGAELAAYRIVQEAITNTLKHASHPTALAIRVAGEGDWLLIEVADDGQAPASSAGDDRVGDGQGLVGMRERAAVYGGAVTAGRQAAGWVVRARLRVVA